MAGWIKFEKATLRKPEIGAISAALGLTPFETLYRCLLVWSWADDSCTDGFLPGIDVRFVDTVAGRQGFGSAMERAGWLVVRHDGVEIPEFEKWMGQSEKKRERQRRHREGVKVGGATVAPSVAPSVAPHERLTSPSYSQSLSPSSSEVEKTKTDSEVRPPVPGTVQEWPAFLADEWCFLLTRRRLGSPRDLPSDMAGEFRELIRLGQKPDVILASIRDQQRDRGEHFWQFRDRIQGGKLNGHKQKERANGNGRTAARYDANRDGEKC